MKEEDLYSLPFDKYLIVCWEHAKKITSAGPAGKYVFDALAQDRAFIEAIWARRYYFKKCHIDWEAVAADQAMTIGLLKLEISELKNDHLS